MQPLPAAAAAQQARRFAALGDPTRLQVFRLLSAEPRSVAEVARLLPVSRPAVSQHLKVLHDAGLVAAQQHGTRHVYRPAPEGLALLRDALDSFWAAGLDRFRDAAEAAARATEEPTP